MDRFELVEDVKVDDRIVDATVRLPTGRDDGTAELLSSFVESSLDRCIVAVSHGAEDSTESGFGSFEIDDVESIFDRVPIADEEGGFDVEGCENALPIDFVAATVEETDDVGPHRVCGREGRVRREDKEGAKGNEDAP